MTFSPFAISHKANLCHERPPGAGYRLPINGDFVSFSQIRKRDRDVIQRMDFDVLHTFTQALVQFNGE
jgi:hypothetical protein